MKKNKTNKRTLMLSKLALKEVMCLKNFNKLVCAVLIFNMLCIVPEKVNASPIEVSEKNFTTSARYAVAIDSNSKVVLYDQNAHSIVPMASTTKIITALVAIKYGDLDRKVEISGKATGIRGSTVGYRKGEMISIRELLYGLMLRSGNDAAIALSEGIAGSVEGFVEIMNNYAKEIGLMDTRFESPHGLDSEKHYSTAYDLAIATAKAKENKIFNDIVSAKDIEGSSFGFTRSYHNINKILSTIPEANGVKTGYTGGAGKCLVSSIDYGGRDIIVVVLNCYDRWNQTKRIYDYVVENYEYRTILEKEKEIATVKVKNSNYYVPIESMDTVSIPVKKEVEIKKDLVLPKEARAPIKKGDKIGLIKVYEQEELIYTHTLTASKDVNENFTSRLKRKILGR